MYPATPNQVRDLELAALHAAAESLLSAATLFVAPATTDLDSAAQTARAFLSDAIARRRS